MPYIIADESFPTKKALTQRARQVLARTPEGQPVAESDWEFLLALFQHHDEWVEKSAGGVRQITTQRTVHGTRCFILIKHRDEAIDISFHHAIRLIPNPRAADLLPQRLRDFRNAARAAIRTQIYEFRDKTLRQALQCPITRIELYRSNAAVDHEPPHTFDELVFRFCKEQSLNPLEVSVSSESGVLAVFEDPELQRRWQNFHQAQASLRLVSRIGNLQLSKPKVSWAELWS